MTNQVVKVKKNLAEFKVGVDNVIFSVDTIQNQLLILLVKREEEPFKEYWSLPGTLVKQEESLESAAYRTLADKITVNNLYLEQLYTFDHFSNPQFDRYLCVTYFALMRYEDAKITKNIKTVTWINLNAIPPLAFDHNNILEYGYQRLRNKLEYSPIAFDVLPKLFTLYDLYQLYITVLGENFTDYSNFRSRLLKLGFLIDTGEKAHKGAGRPATLYRFDSKAFAPLKDKPLLFI